jgi:hypothetical protein
MNTDHRWIARNFGKLMDAHGGRYVAVVRGKVVAAGARPELVEARAQKLTGARTPAVVMVPAKEALGQPSVRLFGLS